ncbi:MAG: MFS transporter [Limisphaerales bacterium]
MSAAQTDAPPPATGKETFPPGIHHAFLFSTFNGLSFQIVLSSPMVLYAKTLGASATVLGIIAGMMPLLVIFQIPAARHVERIGYKKFVYAGWGTRVMFIFALALVPWTGTFLNATTQVALLLMLLFGFNLSRGISSCAWLPWIASLIPASIRGKYLARDAACVNLASFVAFMVAAGCLSGEPRFWQFSVLFAFSALMGLASLAFLKRIPEVAVSEPARASTTPVPWREIAGYAPFRKLLRMNLAWSAAYGGLTAFVVAFLKMEAGMSEEQILVLTSTSFLGGLSSLWFLGSRMDRLGSKPVLTFSFLTWIGILAAWTFVAGHVIGLGVPLIVGLQLLMGLVSALVNMANLRLAMTIIPVMGRSHFFALFSVVGNLTQGVAPVLWGLLIDAVGTRQAAWRQFQWNRFSLFFAAVALVFVVALFLSRRLDEPAAASMDALLRDILVESPQRVWLRVWPRSG